MDYIPTTPAERARMLEVIGVSSVDELFADIPADLRHEGDLNLPAAMFEAELQAHLSELAGQNATLDGNACFMGGGAYDHLIPAAVRNLVNRHEFVTAYTPYQAEISQGVLQGIYEFQSYICLLTGMDVANASVYDGGSACAEAAVMACRHTGRSRVLMLEGVHPAYRQVADTYLKRQGVETAVVPMQCGRVDLTALQDMLTNEVAGVLVQHPNFFGNLEPVHAIGPAVHAAGALFAACVNPISLGVLAPPAAYGADIALGEGQPLGNPISFGGPYLGFLAVRQELIRRMPGRIVGATVDHKGRRGFVLTLQAREQHIRREKAASNICTNQALNALAATIYLALLGKQGLVEVARLCLQKAHYACELLTRIPEWRRAYPEAPFFHEFTLTTERDVAELNERLLAHRLIGPLPLTQFGPQYAGQALFCVTEARTRAEIERLAGALRSL